MKLVFWVKSFEREFLKFLLVGGLNFAFTFALFYLCVRIYKINHLVSLMAVSFLGMFLTYCLNYAWVFKPEQKISFGSRLLKYIFSGSISVGLNMGLLHFFVIETGADPFIVQTALIPLVVVLNFFSAKFWSLRVLGS